MDLEICNIRIHFRINKEENDWLIAEAEKRKLTKNQAAKIILIQTISGFDQKQESLLRRIDEMEEHNEERFKLLLRLCSIGAASGALPLDADSHDSEKLRLLLKKHFSHSSMLGKDIVEMIQEGKL